MVASVIGKPIEELVGALFAYNHHFKWWREMKTEQLAWDRQREPGGRDRRA